MGQERMEDGSRIEQRLVKDGAEMGQGWSTDGLINERYGFDLREEVRLK